MSATVPDVVGFPGITLAESDGVPLLLAPREGNTTGGIVFRVGSAHETLATSGITHLVEHLALRDQVLSEAHLNGHTHADVTVFHVTGSASDVVAYLNDVCAALRDLPLDQLDTEKDILRSESDGRSPGFAGRLRLNRHGSRGHGLVANGERGLDRLTADEARAWSRTWFTRQNAVAWFTGDAVPDGLDLRLPEGRRMPAPEVTDVLGGTPALLTGLRDGVALDAVVPRGDAAYVASLVTREALHRELRTDADLASSVDVGYEVLDPEHARVLVVVQAVEGREDAVAGGVVDALGTLRFHVTDADLAAARALALERLAELTAASPADLLPTAAHRLVTGRRVEHHERTRARLEGMTADDVRAAVRDLWASALWYAPAPLDWAGVAVAPQWSREAVRGRTFPRIDAPDVSLVLAADGVGIVTPDGPLTVRFADCVLLETVPDGARALTGADGFRVTIEPTLFRGLTAAEVAAHVDPNVPTEVVVRLPARAPADVPAPATRSSRKGRGAASRALRSVGGTVGLVAAVWLAGLLLVGWIQQLASEVLGLDLHLGLLPLLACVWATFAVINKRHRKGER